MTINRVVAAAVCAVVLGVVGCAKEAPSIILGAADESFQAWLAKYDPAAERKENGIYLRFIERGTSTLAPTANQSWLRVNYTLYAMNGVVGGTRNGTLSKLIGQSVPITHFGDDLLPYYSTYSNTYYEICEGLRSAIQYLRAGDSVRLYIPTSLGYLSANNEKGMLVNVGYAGETTGYIDRPCYFDLRVNEVINDPRSWEQKIVEQYVVKSWGISASDSVVRGLYMRVLDDPSDSNTTPITKDSTVRYYYATRFLDNHLIRSNVKQVLYKAKYNYSNSPALDWDISEPVSFTPSDFEGTSSQTDSSYRKVLAKLLPKARAGQTIEFVTISDQIPFGAVGSLSAIPQILPYEPRRMQLKLLRWNDKTEQALYKWDLLF